MTHLWNWSSLVMCQKLELVLFFFTTILMAVRNQLPNVSKTLTDTQCRYMYSQIHKEALAVVFARKKFQQFLYGRHFILVMDIKLLALLALFGPSK